jgi:hypothetical protein
MKHMSNSFTDILRNFAFFVEVESKTGRQQMAKPSQNGYWHAGGPRASSAYHEHRDSVVALAWNNADDDP